MAKSNKINNRLFKRNLINKKQINKKDYGNNLQHVFKKMLTNIKLNKHITNIKRTKNTKSTWKTKRQKNKRPKISTKKIRILRTKLIDYIIESINQIKQH